VRTNAGALGALGWGAWTRRGASLACGGLALGWIGAAEATPFEASEPLAAPAVPVRPLQPVAAEPRASAPWPQLASLVPGVLVHGSGTWLQGRTRTTERFLLLEASALVAILAGALVIYETGAARDYAGAATLAVASGVGVWSASFLANVYATLAPPAGWGGPLRRLPWLETGLGYTFVDDAQFEQRHLATTRLDGRLGPWHLLFDAAQSPSSENQWLELQAGYRVLGPRASERWASDGSYLEPQIGISRHAFGNDGFVSSVLSFELEGRLDAERLLPDVRGAFFQGAAGWARQWVSYPLPGADPVDSLSMLLVHVGFGLYFGRRGAALTPAGGPSATGAEVELYYDHRRDGLAGGIQTADATSGFAGHCGLTAQWFFTPVWGVRALAEVGSSRVLGLSAALRLGAQ
jgi:hypothetical protein